MTKADADFDSWFSVLQVHLLDRIGLDFNDEAAVKGDYEEGRDVFDVIDEISEEHAD
jgi:hypothetical protein